MLTRLALTTTLAALLALPAAAAADTWCVQKSGCAADHTKDTLQAAVNDNTGFHEGDRVEIGAVQLELPASYYATKQVQIVGAGADQTTLMAPATGAYQYGLYLYIPGSSVSDLTVNGRNSTFVYSVLLLNGSTADRVNVVGSNPSQIGARFWVDGTHEHAFRDGVVELAKAAGTTAFYSDAPNGTVEDVTLTAGTGITAVNNLTVRRARVTAARAVTTTAAPGGTVRVETAELRLLDGLIDPPIGIYAVSSGAYVRAVNANHVTIYGTAGEGLRAAMAEYPGCAGPPTGSATIVFRSSVIAGVPTTARRYDCSGGYTCPGPAAGSANTSLQYAHSEFYGDYYNGSGCSAASNWTQGNPAFVSGTDLRPRGTSQLVDGGDPAPLAEGESATDLAGKPRVVEGDGKGATPVSDKGAYEYQRQAPTLTASASPGEGLIEQLFSFSATASDPDGDELKYVWEFDDGDVQTAAKVDRKFGSLGSHSGTVTVLDEGGLSAAAAASVTVTSPPSPPPPPVDVTPPAIGAKGGTVRVDAKRKFKLTISCAAAEPAACMGEVATATRKKIKLKKNAKKAIVALGKAGFSVAPGTSQTVRIKLSKDAYKYLRRKRKLAIVITATATDAAGNKGTATAKATLKPAKKKRKKRH